MPSYMNEDSSYVTEGFLDAIFNIVSAARLAQTKATGTRNSIYSRKNATKYNMSSIAKASKDLVMSFPVLSTDTIQPETALMLTKAIERNNVSMLQMLIGAYHINANNGLEAIKMIHTNMDQAFKAEDLIDAAIGVANYAGITYEGFEGLVGTDRPKVNYAMCLEDAKIDFITTINKKYPSVNISEASINDYFVTNHFGNPVILKEAPIFDDNGNIVGDDGKPIFGVDTKYMTADEVKELLKDAKEADQKKPTNRLNAEKIALDKNKFEYQRNKDAAEFAMKQLEYRKNRERENRQVNVDSIRLARELFQKQILDSDVKKSNEVQPTLIVVPFFYVDDTGAERSQEFIAGVKGRLIVCSSGEIIEQVGNFKKSNINLFNLIKATTKETSFAKEFVGAVDQAKIDARRDSKLTKTSPIWRMLQNRSSRSGIQRLARMANSRNAAAAITTLVLTIQEADYIAENFGIDITNPVTAREFMEAYNLLCLIIVDEQTETTKWLYDGEKYFSDYSFSALERDNNSNDTRKLISLLNKTR